MNLSLFLIGYFATLVSSQSEPSCSSQVFCQGNLLHTIQMARLFDDSKHFVDLKLVNDEATTLQRFDQFYNETGGKPSKDEIQQFVQDNFESYDEFEDWIPKDYTDNPKFLNKILDEQVKNFAKELIRIWPQLAKKIKSEVLTQPELFTLLPVENGFVIPGGRFKEFYYWDSYWIIKGLLLSEMYDTVRGMLDNFLLLVERYGFIPNGARKYYLNRSQPPLLSLMVGDYIAATNDTAWLANNIRTLDKELRFWLDHRIIEVQKNGVIYELAHYDSESGSPRPESYYEDFTAAQYFSDENDKKQLYADLKSGAESGFDFSSRWIIDDHGGNAANLTKIKTRRIIPVDLNSFLCAAFRKLSEFYVILHDFNNATIWLERSNTWKKNIEEVLYNEQDGIWYDWDVVLSQPRNFFFPSNLAPLWAEAYDPINAEELGQRAAEYLVNKDIMSYQGGTPTSLSHTGEQWDYPNAWPPLQHVIVVGLDLTGNCAAKNISRELARRWINANMIGFNETHEMYEKYDSTKPGKYGEGGEYQVQLGFGWTNGVALDMIDKYFTGAKKES